MEPCEGLGSLAALWLMGPPPHPRAGVAFNPMPHPPPWKPEGRQDDLGVADYYYYHTATEAEEEETSDLTLYSRPDSAPFYVQLEQAPRGFMACDSRPLTHEEVQTLLLKDYAS